MTTRQSTPPLSNTVPPWTPLYLHRRALAQYIGNNAPRILEEASTRLGARRLSILDVGCGQMPYRPVLATSEHCELYSGADVSPAPGVIQIDPDSQASDAPGGAYDVVVHFQVLEHVPDTNRFLAECMRVLRPGGLMFCTVPFLFEYHGVPGDYYRWTAQGFERLLSSFGLTDIHLEAVESDWQSALGNMQLVLARRFGYIWTKPLFLSLNLLGALQLGPRIGLSPMTYAAVGYKTSSLGSANNASFHNE